jgi:hypothetical protein
MGKDAIIARNTGSWESPAWASIKSVRDIMVNDEPGGIIDATDKFAASETKLPTRYKISYDFDAIWQANTSQYALRTAFLAGSVLDLAVLDRAATGSGIGHRGEWLVNKFAFEMPLLGEQKLSVQIVPHANYASGQAVASYTDDTLSAGTADSAGTRKRGKDASINNSGGTPVTGARDIKLTLEWGTADGSDRASDFALFLPTQMKYTVEFDIIWDASDSTITALRTAYLAHSAYDGYVLDGAYATSGSWGLHSDFAVTGFAKKMNLREGQLISVKLEPHGNYSTAPTFVTIA